MRKFIILFIFINSWSESCFSQEFMNLVPNPSFEKYDTCPNVNDGIKYVYDWENVCTWLTEYFNVCATGTSFGVPKNDWGYQYPYHGNAYSQIAATFTFHTIREYLGCRLIEPLIANTEYNAEFHVSLAELSPAACDQLSLLITNDKILCPDTTYYTLDNYHPQLVSQKNLIISDTIKWIKVKGSFIASGGEQYLTLGIFVADDNINWILRYPYSYMWSEYYIDDVYVYKSKTSLTAYAGNDSVICQGDSISLGSSNYEDYQYFWSNDEGFSDSTARPWVKPWQTTTYYLKQLNFKHEVSFDTVIIMIEECFDPLTIPNVFTPNGDGKNDKLVITNPGNYNYWLSIYDRWGKLVYSGDDKHYWDGRNNNGEIAEGVYYYYLQGRDSHFKGYYSGVLHLLK